MSDRTSLSNAGDDAVTPITRRPLRAELYKKQVTATRQIIILAMLEIGDSTGQHLKISIPRIAAWSKLDEKSVQRALWGDHRTHPGQPRPKREKGQPYRECPFCPDSLITSRVLQPVTDANWKKHRPAEYRLNLELLDDCPEVSRYLDQQKLNFPPIEKIQRPTVASPSDPRSRPQRPTVASPSDPRSHDSKACDSEPADSKPLIQLHRGDDRKARQHVVVRSHIKESYRRDVGQNCPWDNNTDRVLRDTLNRLRWTNEALLKAVDHRFASVTNLSEDPLRWIPTLANYGSGPLNEFNRPLGGAKHADATAASQDRLRAELAICDKLDRRDAAQKDGGSPE